MGAFKWPALVNEYQLHVQKWLTSNKRFTPACKQTDLINAEREAQNAKKKREKDWEKNEPKPLKKGESRNTLAN